MDINNPQWIKIKAQLEECKKETDAIIAELDELSDRQKKERIYFFAEKLLQYSAEISYRSNNLIMPHEEE